MRRNGAPWWAYLCAAAFLGYFGLLLSCDLDRPQKDGFAMKAVRGVPGLVIQRVDPDSPASRAGIAPDDVLLRADRQPINSRVDWEVVQTTVRFGRPVQIELLRGGETRRTEWLAVRARASYWTQRTGVELLITRGVQLVSLLLGLLVVFRRPFDPGARLGGWLLATIGVLCITFPYRLSDVWAGLPWLVGAALWLPFCSGFSLPALLLSFFLAYPRPLMRSPLKWVAAWVPAAVVVSAHLSIYVKAVYRPTEVRQLPPGFEWRWVVWIGYLVAAAVVAFIAYRRADVVERRRLGVMLLGGGVGALAGGPIALAYWRGSQTGLFESPAVAVAILALLAVPLAFAYAILRHRLFDVRLIVRQGVRYALARRLLISLVPLALVGLAADVYRNRDLAVGELFGIRAPAYLVVVAVALVAQWRRSAWLEALDRRFFRERYDAQRLLRGVIEELHRADTLEQSATRVVARVEEALHPTFVALLTREPGCDDYGRLAAAPSAGGPAGLPGSAKVLALARALGRPLDLSAAADGWLAEQLPELEAAAVNDLGIDLVVPIESSDERTDAVLVLGRRRSEEPYAPEDQDLLWTIARSLGVLGRPERVSSASDSFQECPRCGACYDSGTPACKADTSALSQVGLPRVLVGRYRLEQRLGRGGMGVVYGATDLSLVRIVAVKVLREELVGDRESAERFESEARTSARFAHPHVVTIHDFGVVRGSRGFLVMERLDGRTLRDELVRAGRIEIPRVISIMRGVCSAVEAAHRRNLVHRDLKPENVFLSTNDGVETPKVLDFGIAKVMSAPHTADPGETRAGVMLGTPRYMAPEQLRGEAPAPSWDLWAVAVMTCEMLTGVHPFATVAFGLSSNGVPAASPVIAGGTDMDPRYQAQLARWLSIDPAGRPASAGALFQELEQMLVTR
jgi:eukaryotic-like serine/threonine-protein kinase